MNIDLRLGDCIEVLDTLEGNSIDTCITDPPYGLRFMGKDWDTFKQNRRTKSQVVNMGSGMKALNHEELLDYQLWTEEWVSKIFRVLKPGALLLSFGGTRTYHRMVSGIEDAGFEIKDTIGWVYGQGFPKSYNLGKGIDKFVKTGNASWNGTGDSSNGALGYTKLQYEQGYRPDDYSNRHQSTGEITTEEGMLWNGWGTALKPAMELIVVAMKPVDGTYAENALKWGVAGFWIDGGRIPYAEDEPDNRVGTDFISRDGDASLNANDNQVPNKYYVQMYKPQGRFPANFILSYPEDEYELRDDVSAEDLRKLARWMDENAQY